MLFNSPIFLLVFLPLTLLAVYLVANRRPHELAMYVLLAASLVFYAYWSLRDLLIFGVSLALNYFCFAKAIVTARHHRTGGRGKSILALGIAANLGLLAYYKYGHFAVHEFGRFTGTAVEFPSLALPLAISFFTFQQIAFLVDLHRGHAFDTGTLRYTLFVSFFPQHIAGPIVRHENIAAQFERASFGRPTLTEAVVATMLIVLGLAKKVLLADPLASYADPVFSAAAVAGPLTMWEAWGGALAFSLQIYFDFSGYSDAAVGLALLFGIRLPLNFNSPYKAVDIVDFWRRWHITLSNFLRDYLYIPLGGNRAGSVSRYRNIFITMILGGLWHGANWTFIAWGAIHGSLIIATHIWRRWTSLRILPKSRSGRASGMLLTFLVVTIAWVFFRADNFGTAGHLLSTMFGLHGLALPPPLAAMVLKVFPEIAIQTSLFGNALFERGQVPLFQLLNLRSNTLNGLGLIALLLVACFWLPNVPKLTGYTDVLAGKSLSWLQAGAGARASWHAVFLGTGIALLFWLVVLSLDRPSQFLYFNF